MEISKHISEKAQLIEGIGASSWFTIAVEKSLYRIERFSPEGELECSRLFRAEPNTFDINLEYEFIVWTSYTEQMNKIIEKIINISKFTF